MLESIESFSTPPHGAWHVGQVGDLNLESTLATPEQNAFNFASTQEELATLGLSHGSEGPMAAQAPHVPLPTETLREAPAPPLQDPPSSTSMLTALMAGAVDPAARTMRHKIRRQRAA